MYTPKGKQTEVIKMKITYTLNDMMEYKIKLLNYKAERESKGKSTAWVDEELAEVKADIKAARAAQNN